VAERLERIAHRMSTRQVPRHDVEPDLRDRLWADGEIRAFWLSQARTCWTTSAPRSRPRHLSKRTGGRHRHRRCPVSDGKDTS